MLRTILFIALLGVLVNGKTAEAAEVLNAVKQVNGDDRRRRISTTETGGELFGENGRMNAMVRHALEIGFDTLLVQKQTAANASQQQLLSQGPGDEELLDGVQNVLSSLQEPDHFLYMLYYPVGTMEEQIRSCFYIGVSICIQNRLKGHSWCKNNKAKGRRFRGRKKLPFVGICQLFKGSIGDCELLEKDIVGHGKALGLNLTNVSWCKQQLKSPDPAKTRYFHQLMKVGICSGQKFDTRTVKYTKEKQAQLKAYREKLRSDPEYRALFNKKRSENVKYAQHKNAYMRRRRFENVERERAREKKYLMNITEERDQERRASLAEWQRNNTMVKNGNQVPGVVSDYNWFAKEMKPKIRAEQGRFEMSSVAISKECGVRWRALTDEEKQPYRIKAAADKIRHQKAVDALKKKS